MIYVGVTVGVDHEQYRSLQRRSDRPFSLGTLTDPCDLNAATKGLAISGGVVLVSCEGDLTIHRIDKNTGLSLGVHGTLTATGLPSLAVVSPASAASPVTR